MEGSLRRTLGRVELRHWGVVWVVVTLAGSWFIESWSSMEVAAAPDAAEVGWAIGELRAAAEGRAGAGGARAAGAAGAAARRLPGPARVVLWSDGLPAFRQEFQAATLGDLVRDASAAVTEARSRGRFDRTDLGKARFHLSFIVGEGPVLSWPNAVASASFVTTLDGAALRLRDGTARLYPDDLLRRRLYSAYFPLPGGVMKAGLDVPRTVDALWSAAHLPDSAWDDARPGLMRFRTAEYAERPGVEPAVLVAGREIRPAPASVSDLRASALEGVGWLAGAIQPSGRFDYDYDPIANGPSDPGYSLPRHAGAAYFLAYAHRRTGDPTARDTARRALDWVVAEQMRDCGKAPGKCVGRDGTVDLGSAALSVVAMAEYERSTRENRYVEPMKRILEFVLWMQEPDGDFVHVYDTVADRRFPDRLLYYSGEAALAVIEAYRVTRDAALLDHVRSVLDHLTKRAWSFFGSAYFYGEEHWTCIAANEAFPEVRDGKYLEFCEGFAGFLREMQTVEGEPPFGLEGAYVITPFLAPRTTPVAGRTEATVATYMLGAAMGRPNEVILEQIRRSATFLVRMQYGPAASPLFASPERAAGGMPGGFDDPVVRIDYVQHAGNALLGAAELLADYVIEPE